MTTSKAFDYIKGRFILAATIIGAGMVYLDGTIITVALEPIREEFTASVTDLQWLLDIYLLFLTVPILVAGSLSDRYGRKKLFNIGLIGFTLASAACGSAGSMNQLNIARAFQGAFGGMMLPGSLAILNATFPPNVRGKTVGTWSAFTALTTAIGPILGGWLVDFSSWRAAFYINVPLGLLALALSLKYIPESRSDTVPEKQDWLGIGLVTAGLAFLMYGLIEGPVHKWSDPLYRYTVFAGIAFLIAFIVVETKIANPMIPVALFKYRVFTGITILTLILYFAMSGVFFFIPLLLQQTHDFSATRTGVLLLPLIILLFVLSRWSGAFADKSGPRQLLIVGPIMIALGLFLSMIPGTEVKSVFGLMQNWTPQSRTFMSFLPATVIFGFGLGLTVAPLTTVALAAVPRDMSGLASGFSNAVSRVATILAVAILGAVMVTQFTSSFQENIADLPLSEQNLIYLEAERFKLGGAKPPQGLSEELTTQVQYAIDSAFVDGFRMMMALCGFFALLSALVTVVMIENKVVSHDNHFSSGELEIPTTPHF
ncbi:MFS transporter [Anaerolineales bacterium HSG6]|nr:MFS transporter [Anaerolineales bacterium HSG6]MDM8531158.1 MFS transporter [Anaerolineales bacterium HSG25]